MEKFAEDNLGAQPAPSSGKQKKHELQAARAEKRAEDDKVRGGSESSGEQLHRLPLQDHTA